MSPAGLETMCRKYSMRHFGTCPRLKCDTQPLLPLGTSDVLGAGPVRGFCPRCRDLYRISATQDGAFWGPSFAPLFLLLNPEDRGETEPYEVLLHGFRLMDERPGPSPPVEPALRGPRLNH